VFDRWFSLLYRSAHRRRQWVLGLVLLFTAISVGGLFLVRYDGNIDIMLPPDPEITRSINFLRDSNLSDKMVVSLALTDDSHTKKDLFLAVEKLAEALQPPLFTKVISGVSVGNIMEEFSVLQYGPQVLGEKDLAIIDRQLNQATVAEKMAGIYRQSLRPESIFMASLARTDPLGIKLLLMDKVRALPSSMSYDVAVDEGHFLSRDGRHAMLIIQTPVPMMDAQRSKELVSTLAEKLKALPSYVAADIVGGHLHTVSNERVIKRDIAVASIISTIAFLILFLGVFRDHRVVLVFLIPIVAVAWAVFIAARLEGTLSYLVIGFGSSIAGISSDYGLHVYIAIKRGVDEGQMTKLARLLTIDAATTMLSFGVLYFSLIHGYHQLALFSMLCVFICLLLSVFVLPLAMPVKAEEECIDPAGDDRLLSFRRYAKPCVAVWSVLTVVALWLCFSVKFDSDFKKFDGSGPEVIKAEENFHAVWGGKESQAIFVVNAGSLDEAMEKNDLVFAEARRLLPEGSFSSLALFWPSSRQRLENSERWDRFWADGREKKLRELISLTSGKHGFTDQAFTPFFDGLHAPRSQEFAPSGAISQLQERFVVHKNGTWRILSFFPDRQEYVDRLKGLTTKVGNCFIVSGKAISSVIADFTIRETRVLAPLAILVNVVLAWLFFRNWKETLISLVPILTGIVWFVGIMSLCNIPLNAINIVAAIVSTGVIVDYGIGVTYEYRYSLRIGTVVAVTLSAATNIIGAAALLFAKYPALYSTGVALVTCMVTGYLSAIVVVPALCSLMEPSGRRGGVR
jgi:predicted exporter